MLGQSGPTVSSSWGDVLLSKEIIHRRLHCGPTNRAGVSIRIKALLGLFGGMHEVAVVTEVAAKVSGVSLDPSALMRNRDHLRERPLRHRPNLTGLIERSRA